MDEPQQNTLIRSKVGDRVPVHRGAIGRYVLRRALVLGLTVAVIVYLTIYVVNLGGFLDEVIKGEIAMSVAMRVKGGWLSGLPVEERLAQQTAAIEALERARGLDQPLVWRSARWLWRALTLQWGEASVTGPGIGRGATMLVRDVIRVALPRTLLLFGTSNLLVFCIGLVAGLRLSQPHGSVGSRVAALLSPLSAAPPWVYGILFTVVTFQIPALRSLARTVGQWPERLTLADAGRVTQALALPAASIVASKLVQSINQWRHHLALYRDEDYVELATAEGLQRHRIERQYVLRPALPAVLTHLALLLVALWQEVIVLEFFFRTGGVGHLLMLALRRHDIGMILGLVVIFAYLLAATVLILEIAIAAVDPRFSLAPAQVAARGAARRHRSTLSAGSPPARLRLAFLPRAIRYFRAGLHHALSWLVTLPGMVRSTLGRVLPRLIRQPAAVVGLAGVLLFVLISLYALLTIPYQEAITRWRGVQSVDYARPENALPVWVDWFNSGRMARTVRVDSRQHTADREESAISERSRRLVFTLPVHYSYDRFPQDLAVYFYPQSSSDAHVTMVWRRPDGKEIELTSQRVRAGAAYRASLDKRLKRRLQNDHPEQALFARSDQPAVPLSGDYELQIVATLFAPDDTLEVEVLAYGEIYGLAGTDARRRDLMTAVLWGTPIALAFGVLAALGSTLASAAIAAAAAWYGGIWDGLAQRLSEINMVLPTLAVSLMVFTLYSKSFWVILGVTVALSVFGSGMRTYRAALQPIVKSSWVEAARVQGASGSRIVWRYLLPYLAPVLVPQMVVLVPSYVFLEAALAYLGMSDPSLPTWGLLMHDAFAGDVYGGVYHLVLVPAILLLLMALSFGLLGRSLEGVLNPHLMDR